MGEVVLLWKPGLPLTTTVLRKKNTQTYERQRRHPKKKAYNSKCLCKKKVERSQTNNLMMHIKTSNKQEQTNPKSSKWNKQLRPEQRTMKLKQTNKLQRELSRTQ